MFTGYNHVFHSCVTIFAIDLCTVLIDNSIDNSQKKKIIIIIVIDILISIN